MGLPDADHAVIPLEKVVDYLLSETHRVGRHKAKWFRQQGYLLGQPARLQADLKQCAVQGVVEDVVTNNFGVKYVVLHELTGPLGTRISLRSVWIVESNQSPRFVTAYPAE